ncbi:MAG: hypothetical protein IJK34_03540 [Clostridia bacterium]|nr:hypothetical protein [Clostridia bacterium]
MRKEKIKGALPKSLYYIALLSFILPIGYLVFRIITLKEPEISAGLHSRADYVLMLLECILGIFVIHIPSIISRQFKFEIPGLLYGLYILFLYCAIFLGEVRSFYYLVPHWDDFLHLFSSMMTGFFAVMVITILNRDENLVFRLSPFFVSLFAFAFSITIGALWELYEYAGDGLFGLNMQKFITANGEILSGHDALTDTMQDIAVDMFGALISSVTGGISVKYSKRWLIPTLKKEDISSKS